tara:strand:- start:254 stop:475 length:222 start_codon:yes stop_codon:yes gene_type:complete
MLNLKIQNEIKLWVKEFTTVSVMGNCFVCGFQTKLYSKKWDKFLCFNWGRFNMSSDSFCELKFEKIIVKEYVK